MSQRPDPFDELERLFDDLTDFGTGGVRATPVDVVDEGDAFVVVVDLPGFSTDDIEVQLDNERTLAVRATHEDSERFAQGTYVRRERRQESVDRTVTLPGVVDPDRTEATFDDGVLTVRLETETGDGEGTNIEVT
jgi:HSP20 family protein